jgi:autotransporter-associated beta strand protein
VEWNQKGTTWEDPANWSTGRVPGPHDVAVFPALNEAVKNQPVVPGIVHVGGIRFDNGTSVEDKTLPGGDMDDARVPGQLAWAIQGSGTIVLGRHGIDVSQGNTVIHPALELAVDQTWRIGRPVMGPLQDYMSYFASMPFFGAAMVRHTSVFGYVCHAHLILHGTLAGPGALHKQGHGLILYANDASPTFRGGTFIDEGIIAWLPGKAGQYAFGAGAVSVESGSFYFDAMQASQGAVRLLTPIRVGRGGGEIQHGHRPSGAMIQVGGALELDGPVRWSWDPAPRFAFDGPRIAVTQSVPGSPGIIGGGMSSQLAMPILDGPGEAGNPLILEYDTVLSLLSPHNDYAGPTLVSFMWENNAGFHVGAVHVGPHSSLGRGNLIVQPGGRIHLSAAGNLSARAEAKVEANALALGVLGVGYNGLPKISPDSEGVLAVDCPQFDALADLSKLGNGRMYLGARDRGTFSGAALAPGKDNVYRLGGGGVGGVPGRGWPRLAGPLASGGNPGDHYAADHWIWNPTIYNRHGNPGNMLGSGLLIIEHNVLGGNAQVTVGAMSHFGNAAVLLKSAQTFSGPLTVQGPCESPWLTALVWRGSNLEGVAQTAVGQSPFGSPDGPVHLLNSTLKLTSTAGGQPVAKGKLTFAGQCTIGLDANSRNRADMTLANLVRNDRAVLLLDPAQELLAAEERLLVSSWKADADLLPPYYLYSSTKRWAGTWGKAGYRLDPQMSGGPDFLSYDATGGKGFGRFAAYATDLATATERSVVRLAAGELPAGSHTVRALKVTGNVTGNCRIKIAAGGLILGGNLSADLDFGKAEGVIYGSDLGPFGRGTFYMIWDLKGKVSGSNGLTILSGPLPHSFDWCVPGQVGVFLSNAGNDFRGPLTVNGGSLYAVPDKEENGVFTSGSLGDLHNRIVLDGGSLNWQRAVNGKSCLAPSRTIHLGPGGGCFGVAGGRLIVHAKITGPGALSQISEGATPIVITNPGNDYSGGTWISMQDDGGLETTVGPAGKLGTGPVLVSKDCALALQGDRNIDPHARLNVAYSGVVVFMSLAPVIGSLDGCGIVYLGAKHDSPETEHGTKLPPNRACDTTLTLGADDTDTTFYGSLRQVGQNRGDGVGSLTKTGRGVFTLYGGHTYAGPTTVEQGTLNLRGGVAGDAVVKPAGTLQGSGLIAGALRLEGGTFAVELTGDSVKPLTVQGPVTLDGKLVVTAATGVVFPAGRKWTVLAAAGGVRGKFAPIADGYQVNIVDGGKKVEVQKL